MASEDRDALRIKEKEKRSQDCQQAPGTATTRPPLFAEPYKITCKKDTLSCRVQSTLGNYEPSVFGDYDPKQKRMHQKLMAMDKPKKVIPTQDEKSSWGVFVEQKPKNSHQSS